MSDEHGPAPAERTRSGFAPQRRVSAGERRIIADEVLKARVRELVPSRTPERTSLLRHPITTAVVTFVLTGLLGTVISAVVQQRNEYAARRARQHELRLASAAQVSDSLGAVLNEGMLRASRYYQAVQREQPSDSISAHRVAFLRFADRFEARDILDAARICRYFGPLASREYGDVNRRFRYLAAHLREYERRRARTYGYDSLTMAQFSELVEFEKRVYRLLYSLAATPPIESAPTFSQVLFGAYPVEVDTVNHGACEPLRTS